MEARDKFFACLLFGLLLPTKAMAITQDECSVLDGAEVYSNDSYDRFLGRFGPPDDPESIMNPEGKGSSTNSFSVRNPNGKYGVEEFIGAYPGHPFWSANFIAASKPPKIYKCDEFVGYLTANEFVQPGASLAEIDAACTFDGDTRICITGGVPPASPNNFSAEDGDDSSVMRLSWSGVAGATGYRIYQKIGDFQLAKEVSGTQTSIDGLLQNTSYEFAVTAVNEHGESLMAIDTGFLREYQYSIGLYEAISMDGVTSFNALPSSWVTDTELVEGGYGLTLMPDVEYEPIAGDDSAYENFAYSACEGQLHLSSAPNDPARYITDPLTGDCTVIVIFERTLREVRFSERGNEPCCGTQGGYTISTKETYRINERGSMQVIAFEGYEITSFNGACGGDFDGDIYTSAPLTTDCNLYPEWERIPDKFFVTASVQNNLGGAVSPGGSQVVDAGASLEVLLTADEGFEVSEVGGTCGGGFNSSTSTFTTNPITEDCSVVARFSPQTFAVRVAAGPNGNLSPSTDQTATLNEKVIFIVAPNDGYRVADIGGTCGGTLSGSIFTTSAVVKNCTVMVTFEPNQKPIAPTVISTGFEDGKIILAVSVSDDGGAEILGYGATCSDGTNTFTGTSTLSPITVAGLTNDVAYTCTVTATNSVGTSSASAPTDPITPEATATGLPIWLLYQATQ